MATSTLQHHQPIQADDMPSPVLPSPPHGADHQPHDDYVASSLQDATPDEIPDTKSGVRVDPAAAMVSPGPDALHHRQCLAMSNMS